MNMKTDRHKNVQPYASAPLSARFKPLHLREKQVWHLNNLIEVAAERFYKWTLSGAEASVASNEPL